MEKWKVVGVLAVLGMVLGMLVWEGRGMDWADKGKVEFQEYLSSYQKTYSSESERERRFSIFRENTAFILQHNAKNPNFQLSLNHFADLKPEELPLGLKFPIEGNRTDFEELETKFLPEKINWIEKGAVTKVKNQKDCGSCWAFSAVGAIEGAHFLKTGKLVRLSEQQLVDCAGKFETRGCKGGQMDKAFEYVLSKGGLMTSKAYPYKGEKNHCQVHKFPSAFKATISGFKDVRPKHELQLKAAAATGPVSVAIQASAKVFQFYKKGVIDRDCGHALDHGVLLVGYGEERGLPYWLVKNSWGRHWGEEGFVKILRNDSNFDGPGTCGIALFASYPY